MSFAVGSICPGVDYKSTRMYRYLGSQKRDHCPGRTFLGKRRYFSGIAALTPLTPLTYKQNTVNALIPTKKRR